MVSPLFSFPTADPLHSAVHPQGCGHLKGCMPDHLRSTQQHVQGDQDASTENPPPEVTPFGVTDIVGNAESLRKISGKYRTYVL